ncbi:glutathione S-transferase family protein [Acuticoccus sp.]|uniref:glutathione S-transferase family protein n=1 Tax=Acuticoccus sp. TaxID=1904378 RepID=UPI003B52C819
MATSEAASTEATAGAMTLAGRNLSPYARRVAIWCALQGRPLERAAVAAMDPADAATLRSFHPGMRVPALRLADGTTLIDTFAICDWLDETADGARLVPEHGAVRRDCLQRIALAHATTEKIVALVYERNRRPEALHWADWQERIVMQIRGGFEAMEAAAKDGFHGGGNPDGSDIAIVCAYQMAGVTNPFLIEDRYPKLAALAERAMALPEFADTYPTFS